MSQFGAAGPEIVSKHLNAYFGNLISTVEEYGGDVIKSAGDALICLFGRPCTFRTTPRTPEARSATPRTPTQPLFVLAMQAIQCALAIRSSAAEYDSQEVLLLLLQT